MRNIPHNLQHQRARTVHSFAVEVVVGAVADLLPYIQYNEAEQRTVSCHSHYKIN